MLAHDTAEIARPIPLSEEEKEVIERLKEYRMAERLSIHELAADLKMETHVLGPLFRTHLGIDPYPETLSQPLRDKVFGAMREWLDERDALDEIIELTTRRMANIYTDQSLAQHLGVSPDELRLVLNGKGGQLNPAQCHRRRETVAALSAWLDTDEAADIDGIALTPTIEHLKNAYHFARTTYWIVSIVGDVGIGKSLAAMHEVRENPKTRYRPGTVYVRIQSGDSTRKAILARIVQALYDLGVIQSTAGDPMTILKDNLGSDDLLIIDEFQFALEEDIKAGKVFHDIANDMNTHVVLQGNPSLNTTLWNEKNHELDGLANRTLPIPHLSTTRADVEAFMLHHGHDAPALIKAAADVVARPGPGGGLRTLKKLLDSYRAFSADPLNGQGFRKHARAFGHYSPAQKK
jgi:transcriptional regulator with XRE-family HTH domain